MLSRNKKPRVFNKCCKFVFGSLGTVPASGCPISCRRRPAPTAAGSRHLLVQGQDRPPPALVLPQAGVRSGTRCSRTILSLIELEGGSRCDRLTRPATEARRRRGWGWRRGLGWLGQAASAGTEARRQQRRPRIDPAPVAGVAATPMQGVRRPCTPTTPFHGKLLPTTGSLHRHKMLCWQVMKYFTKILCPLCLQFQWIFYPGNSFMFRKCYKCVADIVILSHKHAHERV